MAREPRNLDEAREDFYASIGDNRSQFRRDVVNIMASSARGAALGAGFVRAGPAVIPAAAIGAALYGGTRAGSIAFRRLGGDTAVGAVGSLVDLTGELRKFGLPAWARTVGATVESAIGGAALFGIGRLVGAVQPGTVLRRAGRFGVGAGAGEALATAIEEGDRALANSRFDPARNVAALGEAVSSAAGGAGHYLSLMGEGASSALARSGSALGALRDAVTSGAGAVTSAVTSGVGAVTRAITPSTPPPTPPPIQPPTPPSGRTRAVQTRDRADGLLGATSSGNARTYLEMLLHEASNPRGIVRAVSETVTSTASAAGRYIQETGSSALATADRVVGSARDAVGTVTRAIAPPPVRRPTLIERLDNERRDRELPGARTTNTALPLVRTALDDPATAGAVTALRDVQRVALVDRAEARTDGDRDGVREATLRFRDAVHEARNRIRVANGDDELPPLLREWRRRGPSGAMHTVRRRDFYRT